MTSVHRGIGTRGASTAGFGAAGALASLRHVGGGLLLRGRILAARVPATTAGIALLAHASVLALLHARLHRILRAFGLLELQQTVDRGQQTADSHARSKGGGFLVTRSFAIGKAFLARFGQR